MAHNSPSDCSCRKGENCICETDLEENKLWNELCRQYDEEKRSVQDFILQNNKHADAPNHPLVDFLETKITPLLNDALQSTVKEAEKQNCLDRQRTDFDPIDHIAQYLWNHNPEFPDRVNKYKSIHDMKWVQDYLKQHPRPFFPFHLIWSDEYAAIKIQSYIRGYWVRKQEDVQEVRKFWKQLKDEARRSGTSISRRFYMMD
ncbi:IQ domain-containing protein K-like [Coccinella septempunctata]|uniref:IQ domain-containing protein K-like n=1 Tax=Coccinella septempunctata TaxID=41139 RepID=UPI001D05D35D|nr:IQ domain-containing protein K-like [Coccinella septempunctata]